MIARPKAISDGFTAVELLVTLFIGLIFIILAHQIYIVGVRDSAAIRQRVQASNYAYNAIQTHPIPRPCTASTYAPVAIPSGNNVPPGSTIAFELACPYGNDGLTRITAIIRYKETTLTHAYIK